MRLIGAVARLQGRLEYLVNDMTAWGLRGCRAVYWHMICPRGHKKRAHQAKLACPAANVPTLRPPQD